MANKNHQKGVFITIIVLLVLFVPLSVFSFVLHVMKQDEDTKLSENTEHLFKFNNQLYFYKEDGTLIGTYACQNPSGVCDYANSSDDDKNYDVDYYPNENEPLKMIRNRYAFIIDDNSPTGKIIFYDIVNGQMIGKYQAVKNYGVGIENDLYIVTNEAGKVALLSLENSPTVKIKFEYDYLGVANLLNEDGLLMSDFFVGKKGQNWYLLDKNGAVLTDVISKNIVSYNGKNIITKDADGYYVVNYNDQELLDSSPFQNLSFTSKYLNVLTKENEFYVYDLNRKEVISTPLGVKSSDKVTSKINSSGELEIILNEKVMETVSVF